MRRPTRLFKKRGRTRLRRALLVAVVMLAGGGEGAALALLPPDSDPDRSGPRSPALAAAATSATAPPTRFGPETLAARRQRGGRAYYRTTASRHVAASTEKGFIGLYREVGRAFAVSWRLIASIHRQETAFSSVPSTYHGLNAFGCCAGPMQFNVTNGPPSTWALYRDSFRQGRRPRRYPHRTRSHPSVYDDFDAMMAAGALLRDGGASEALDGGSWAAAYAYYGHDLFGVDYANQVLGRAQGWELYGFCLNCPPDAVLVDAFDGAYGSEARELLLDAEKREAEEKRKQREKARKARAKRDRANQAETPRDAADRQDRSPAPALPERETTPSPEPQTTVPRAPTVTEPPAQPAPPQPAKQCSRLERLLGCRPGA